MVGAVSGQGNARWAVFFGDGHANVFALDAQTGRQLWKTRVDDHVVARITGSVKYHEGRVYVPISGSEEFNSGNKDYPCCTARGGVAALDASTGKEIWKTYLADPPKVWKTPANGAKLYGPATGGVWNSPTIDTVRGALYVGTGDAVTPPESPLTDAVHRPFGSVVRSKVSGAPKSPGSGPCKNTCTARSALSTQSPLATARSRSPSPFMSPAASWNA